MLFLFCKHLVIACMLYRCDAMIIIMVVMNDNNGDNCNNNK